MALEQVLIEHLPASHKIHAAFFRNVQNASFLHQQLLELNSDFEYAFIDASVILSRLQLFAAIFKATSALVNGTLQTPNVHSETVTSLSSSKNIAEAYRRFGISPATKDLIVVKVTFSTDSKPEPASANSIWEHLNSNVEGEALPLTNENIASATDLLKVRKYYKLNGLKWLDAIKDKKEQQQGMEALVISGMALRGL